MSAADQAPRPARAAFWRNLLITAVIAFIAGAGGAVLGAKLVLDGHSPDMSSLHALAHEGLDLSPEQQRRLERLEADFAGRRDALEASVRQADADLAAVLSAHPSFTPQVEDATDRVHATMGELQRATIRHVYDMRAILDERQAVIFDERVADALTASAE